ncbi:MAG TPA: ATP-binding protein, partial [Phycisphaeraceae bacterium]
QRLAELGTLTGGLAHEIKNPLSTIGLNMQLLQEDLAQIAASVPPDSPLADSLGRVQRRFGSLQRETQRLREILEDFLRFAGRMRLERQPADLNELVDELADFFEPQARAAGVRLRRQLNASPASIHVDASLLKQALLNLLLNATQAMSEARQKSRPHGGADELILRTERQRSLGQDELLIHVTDTGPGIDNDVLDKLFQPYFSTKRGGSGLGLPTTRRIVEEHGGQIQVHSEVGRGSDFVVRLPLQPPAP